MPWVFATAGILALTVIGLRLEGRIWWCACGGLEPWKSDVWTSHCSQHLIDPYSITHMSHGLIFFLVAAALRLRWSLWAQIAVASALAGAWEIAENSPFVIDRYRTATMSLDYLGDSIVNALGDMASCILGLLLARRIGVLWTILLLVGTELLLLALIRDNLSLNVVMLIAPIEAVKNWQSAGHMPSVAP